VVGGWRRPVSGHLQLQYEALPGVRQQYRPARIPGDPALEYTVARRITFRRVRTWTSTLVRVRTSLFAAEMDAEWLRCYTITVRRTVESRLGLGVSGGVALEQWAGRWVARSASFADWRHRTSDTAWTHSFAFGYARAVIQERQYDRLATGHDLACGALARVAFSGDRLSRAVAYEASVLVKRPLRGGWLYGYVEPVVRWERAAAGIRMRVCVLASTRCSGDWPLSRLKLPATAR
jgi:hypothetical protein